MKKLKEQLIQLQVLSELSTELLREDNTEALKPTVRKMSSIIAMIDLTVLEKPEPQPKPVVQTPAQPPKPATPPAPANNPQPPKANTNDKSNEAQVRPV